MSKKETQVLFRLISEFINGLSNEQYENLVYGNASIEYKENRDFSFYKRLKETLIQCKTIEEIERNFEGFFKEGIISFCEFYEIDVKKRDTKKVIYQKIAAHFNIDELEASQVKEEGELEKVKEIFQKFSNMEEAKQYLTNHHLLKTKKDIIRFAKLLDVYVNPKHSKAIILNRVIESVIGSQVRAKVITEG